MRLSRLVAATVLVLAAGAVGSCTPTGDGGSAHSDPASSTATAGDRTEATPCQPRTVPCVAESAYGAYAVLQLPAGPRPGLRPALFVDVGGPGVPVGMLGAVSVASLPAELVEGRLVIAVAGARHAEVDESCLAALDRYVTRAASDADQVSLPSEVRADVVSRCQLQELVASYDRTEAAFVEKILHDEGVGTYDLVGSSFAAGRWQALVPQLGPVSRPSSITVVSPLPLGSDLVAVTAWQGQRADATWADERCTSASCREALAAIKGEPRALAGLLLSTTVPSTVEQIYAELERATVGGRADLIGTLADLGGRYFHLNAARFPSEDLVEYLVGVCRVTRADALADGAATDASSFERLARRFHSVCSDLAGGHPAFTTPDDPVDPIPCFVDLAGDAVVPPSTELAPDLNGIANTLLAADGDDLGHGDLAALAALDGGCGSYPSPEPRWPFVRSGLVGVAREAVGAGLYLPPAGIDAEYILSDVLVQVGGDRWFVDGFTPGSAPVDGYCLVGSIAEGHDTAGYGYVIAVGLESRPAPGCVADESQAVATTTTAELTVVEYLDCGGAGSTDACGTGWLRQQLQYLDNGTAALALTGSAWRT